MTEQNPRAFIGANNPPPFNQAEVDTLNAEAGQFLDVAGEWIEAGEIIDDGQAQNKIIEGNGLKGMKERVSNIGGQLHYSKSAKGFELRIQLPIN